MVAQVTGDSGSSQVNCSPDQAASPNPAENNPLLESLRNVASGENTPPAPAWKPTPAPRKSLTATLVGVGSKDDSAAAVDTQQERATIRGDGGMAAAPRSGQPGDLETFEDDVTGPPDPAPGSIDDAEASVQGDDADIEINVAMPSQEVTEDWVSDWMANIDGMDEMEAALDALDAFPEPEAHEPLDVDADAEVNAKREDLESSAQVVAQKRLPPNAPGGPAAGPAVVSTDASNVAENPSCLNQLREKQLNHLFSEGGGLQEASLTLAYAESDNAYAQLTVLNFAGLFKAACDNVNSSDATREEKDALLAPLKAVAKDYLNLIQAEGLDKKSPFGAFYLGQKDVRRQRVKLEDALIKLSGSDTPEGRGKLHERIWLDEVKPYIQNFLNEKFSGSVNGIDRAACEALVDNHAAAAMRNIFSAIEDHASKNGASVNRIAGALELIAMWPELMRGFVEPKAVPATKAVKPEEPEEEEEAPVFPEVPDANGGPSEPAPILKPGPRQAPPIPPRPLTGSASLPGPTMPASAPDGGKAPVPQIVNNYNITNSYDYSDHSVNGSYNRSESSSDSADVGYGFPAGRRFSTFDGRGSRFDDSVSVADQNLEVPVEETTANASEINLINFEEIPAELPLNSEEGVDEIDAHRNQGEDSDARRSRAADIANSLIAEDKDGASDVTSSGTYDPELTRLYAGRNSMPAPRRPYDPDPIRPYDAAPHLDSIADRNSEGFERKSSANGSKAGSIPIQFVESDALPSAEMESHIRTVDIVRRTEQKIEGQGTWRKLATDKSIKGTRWLLNRSPDPKVNMTVARYVQHGNTGRPFQPFSLWDMERQDNYYNTGRF
jgi:hypothetical protein